MRRLLAALMLVLAGSGAGRTEETAEGRLTGQVVDAQGAAIPGATVSISSSAGARTVTTADDGRFVADGLAPGTYAVRAEITGFAPADQRGIVLTSPGQRELRPLVLKYAGSDDVISLDCAAAVVNTASATAASVIEDDVLNRMALRRDLPAVLHLAAGVSASSGAGGSNPSISGASGLENQVVIDGVNVTDVAFGSLGSYNTIHGSLGQAFSTEFIREVEVKTAGFEAEYGQSTGGVATVETRSGGNEFHGAVFGYTRPAALESDWRQLRTPQGSVNTLASSDHDLGASLSGPLVKEKAFFFASFDPQWQRRTFLAPELHTGSGFPVPFPYREQYPDGVERRRRALAYAARLTWQASPSHRIDVTGFGDPSQGAMGLQRVSTLRRVVYSGPGVPGTRDIEGGFSELAHGGHAQGVRYDGILSSSWIVEATLARSTGHFHETAWSDEPQFTDLRALAFRFPGVVLTQPRSPLPAGITGGLGTIEDIDGENRQLGLKATSIFNAAGNHQVRFGLGYEDATLVRRIDWTGRSLQVADGRTLLGGSPVQVRSSGSTVFYRATRGRLVPAGENAQSALSLFAQDTWQIGTHLTLRPGLRYESETLRGVEPSLGGAPALCHPDDSRPGAGDGRAAAIPCSFTWDGNWAPRLGVVYDLQGNGRSKLYAAYSRYFTRLPTTLAALTMSADPGITRQNYRDAALAQPVPNATSGGMTTNFLLSSDHATAIDPDSRSGYQDEWLGGLEVELPGRVGVGLRYVRRDVGRVLEDIGTFPVLAYFVTECDRDSAEYRITNVSASTPAVSCPGPASFEDAVHRYQAVELTLNRASSGGWSLLASYRHSRLRGNYEGSYRSDNGESVAAFSHLFDVPTNDASYASERARLGLGFRGDIRYLGTSLGEGTLPNDRPHQLKVYGHRTWKRLGLGLALNLASGRPLTALASNPAYAAPGEVPETLRGAGILTVDGFRERAAGERRLDLHADYSHPLGDDRRLVLLADVFNLLGEQAPLQYDEWDEINGLGNANFGQPVAGGGGITPSFSAPRSVRLGARLEW